MSSDVDSVFFFFQAEDGIRDLYVTGVQTCALPILYVRGVLDDKTRILCVVGQCVALDEMVQGENHIRAALALGATPREVQEVAVQSTQYWGMPRSLRAMSILERILREQNRLSELTETQLPMPASR